MGGAVGDFLGDVTGMSKHEAPASAANPGVGNGGQLDWNLGNKVHQMDSQNYAQFLANQTSGMQPSIAQAQLKAATDQNLANQMAIAASARGPSAGTTHRLMMQNAAATGQESAQQNAMLASQENQMNAANALKYQGMNNQFAQYLYGLGNQRDLGLMQGQIQGGLGAAGLEQQDAQRRQKGFGDLMGNASKAAAMAGA